VKLNYVGSGGGKQGLLETISDDMHFSRQFGLYNDGTFSLSPAVEDAYIDMEPAWDIQQCSSDIIVAIFDVTGKEMPGKTEMASEGILRIDVSGFPGGLYLVLISDSGHKVIGSTRIVVK